MYDRGSVGRPHSWSTKLSSRVLAHPQPGYFIRIGGTGMLNDVSNWFGKVDFIDAVEMA